TANKLSDKAYLGKEATYNLVLKNTGRERDTFTLRLVNHDGSRATLTAAALELNPQASGTLHLYVGAEKPGVYRVEVIANSRGDVTKVSSITTTTRIEEKMAAPPATVLTLALLREIASQELKGKEFYRADPSLYGPLATVNEYPEPAGEAMTLEGDVYVIASTRISSKYQKADTIVVARGDLPVDSAAAVPYARLLGAPILLTRPGDLPQSTLAALERLGPKRIVVVGGPQAVSEGVVSDLQRLAPVERKAGGTRVETALALAREVKGPALFVVATGKSPLDTTIASAAYNAPVLYVEAGRVPGGVKEYLREHRGARVLFAPDVPRNVRAEVEGLLNP
ncbi:MAG: cell wall-binding repeat-containing protein, partial [Candidatus Hydrothermarchaeota archaeon]